MSIHLEIVTPNGAVLSSHVDEVRLPGALGEFAVLQGHIPFMSSLKAGVVTYVNGNQLQKLAIGNGVAEVGAYNHVLVLTDTYAFPKDVNVEELQGSLRQYEAKLNGWKENVEIQEEEGSETWIVHPEYQELVDQIAWMQAQIDVKAH